MSNTPIGLIKLPEYLREQLLLANEKKLDATTEGYRNIANNLVNITKEAESYTETLISVVETMQRQLDDMRRQRDEALNKLDKSLKLKSGQFVCEWVDVEQLPVITSVDKPNEVVFAEMVNEETTSVNKVVAFYGKLHYDKETGWFVWDEFNKAWVPLPKECVVKRWIKMKGN